MLDAEHFKKYFTNLVLEFSNELQDKIHSLQENCKNQQILYYDLDNMNPMYCGLGCQLHGISASLLCAIENNLQFAVINYQQNQYEDYLLPFWTMCQDAKMSTINFLRPDSNFN